jgi:hypothetical protein
VVGGKKEEKMSSVMSFTVNCAFVEEYPPMFPMVLAALVLLLILPAGIEHLFGKAKHEGRMFSISRSWRNPLSIALVVFFVEFCVIFYNSICLSSVVLQILSILAYVLILVVVAFNPDDPEDTDGVKVKNYDRDALIHKIFAMGLFIFLLVCVSLVAANSVFVSATSIGLQAIYGIMLGLACMCCVYLIFMKFNDRSSAYEHMYVILTLLMLLFIDRGYVV